MPIFNYKAKSADGQDITGSAAAENIKALAKDLKNSGMLLIEAEDEGRKKKGLMLLSSRISITDRLMLTRNLQIMISTGLPLVKSFRLLAGQAKSRKLSKALLDISEQIGKGKSLSECLKDYPEIFPEIFCNIIAAGEMSGTLEDVLSVLSLQLEREHKLKSKIKKAMIYPAILLVAMLSAGAVAITIFVPVIKSLFSGMNIELPLYTKILVFLGEAMAGYWYLFLLFAFLSAAILFKLVKTEKGKKVFDAMLIKLPVISPIVKKSNTAIFLRSISSLIISGVLLVEALEITSRTVGSYYFKKALKEASEKIKKGEKLFASLQQNRALFPFGTLETIEIGEETGETANITKKLAGFYEEEVMDTADNASAIIEPALIIVLGLAVAFFAFSVISPMYSVLGTIH